MKCEIISIFFREQTLWIFNFKISSEKLLLNVLISVQKSSVTRFLLLMKIIAILRCYNHFCTNTQNNRGDLTTSFEQQTGACSTAPVSNITPSTYRAMRWRSLLSSWRTPWHTRRASHAWWRPLWSSTSKWCICETRKITSVTLVAIV